MRNCRRRWADAITGAYRSSPRRWPLRPGSPASVAVRSSATAEDLPDASFAGQQETYLNVRGEEDLLAACRRCYASLFTDRAISYRQINGFDHLEVALSIGVQRMVRSDLGSAGVMFTLDTETGFRNAVLLNAAYGLGENVVQGSVNPDEILLFKPTLRQGYAAIVSKRLGSKAIRMVYDKGGTVRNEPVPEPERGRYAISDEEALTLARWACLIEDHYSARQGTSTPMDIEWARDGESGELFILQARPETVESRRSGSVLCRWHLKPHQAELITHGRAIGASISTRPRPGDPQPQWHRPLRSGRSAGDRAHRSRLGADPEEGQGGDHRPGRTHLPRGDHRQGDGHHRGRGHVAMPPSLIHDGEPITISCCGGGGRPWSIGVCSATRWRSRSWSTCLPPAPRS
jgi:pyruvate,water dikinase